MKTHIKQMASAIVMMVAAVASHSAIGATPEATSGNYTYSCYILYEVLVHGQPQWSPLAQTSVSVPVAKLDLTWITPMKAKLGNSEVVVTAGANVISFPGGNAGSSVRAEVNIPSKGITFFAGPDMKFNYPDGTLADGIEYLGSLDGIGYRIGCSLSK